MFLVLVKEVAETKIVAPAPKNARGGSWEGSRNARGVPRGVQKLSGCQCSGKISRRDKNCCPSTYKRPGGPERGPGMPGGSLGGSRNRRVANAVVKKVAKMKMVTPAATNALGVLGGVQERPGGPSGGSRNRGDANAPFFPSSQCRCTAFSILNSRMQGTGFAGSSHSRIQNRKGRASLHCKSES